MERRFPVLMDAKGRREFPDCPEDIPWDFIAPHEQWAMKNHSQSLERLAARGGLSPYEILATVEHHPRLDFGPKDQRKMINRLREHILNWAARRG